MTGDLKVHVPVCAWALKSAPSAILFAVSCPTRLPVSRATARATRLQWANVSALGAYCWRWRASIGCEPVCSDEIGRFRVRPPRSPHLHARFFSRDFSAAMFQNLFIYSNILGWFLRVEAQARMSTFHLYIDELGSRMPNFSPDIIRSDRMDYFAFGGALIHEDDVGAVIAAHAGIVHRWGLTGPLHSTKICGRRTHFSWLNRDKSREAAFMIDLEQTILDLPIIGQRVSLTDRGMWLHTLINTLSPGFSAKLPTQS